MTKNFIEFIGPRSLYEKQIREKNKERGTNLIPVSPKASMDDTDLCIYLAAGWIEASSIEKILKTRISKGFQRMRHIEDEG